MADHQIVEYALMQDANNHDSDTRFSQKSASQVSSRLLGLESATSSSTLVTVSQHHEDGSIKDPHDVVLAHVACVEQQNKWQESAITTFMVSSSLVSLLVVYHCTLTVGRPEKHIRATPLKHKGKPSEQIHQVSPLPNHGHGVREGQRILVVSSRVVLQNAFELSRSEVSASIVRLRVRSMLAAMNVGNINSHQGVRKPVPQPVALPRQSWVGEGPVNDEHGQRRQYKAKAQREKGKQGVGWPDDAIAVAVEECNVLSIRKSDNARCKAVQKHVSVRGAN